MKHIRAEHLITQAGNLTRTGARDGLQHKTGGDKTKKTKVKPDKIQNLLTGPDRLE